MAPIQRYNKTGWIYMHEDDQITKSYDNNVGGVYVGECVATVLLKPLEKAIKDGDRIHGVIKGISFKNNGSNGGFTRSSVEDIKKTIISAIKEAQIDPSDLGCFESEGYAHKLEEGLQVAGLSEGIGQFTNRKQYCALGSIVGNVGYVQSAIGVSNMIKLVMAMKHKVIPPLNHFVSSTDVINLCKTPFYVSDISKKWEVDKNKKRYAGMYSSGYGGTNLVTILEEAPIMEKESEQEKQELFTFSAKSKFSFLKGIDAYISFLQKNNDIRLCDICYTTNVRRSIFLEHRLAIIAENCEDLLDKLITFRENEKNMEHTYHSVYYYSKKELNRKRPLMEIGNNNMYFVAKAFCQGTNFKFSTLYEKRNVYYCELPPYVFDKSASWCCDIEQKKKYF